MGLTTLAPGLLSTLAPGLLTTAAPGLLANQLSAPALAGQNVIQVTNQAEFAVGEIIVIDAGTPIEETRTIVGFSSIILDSTLLFDHSVTSPVQRQAVNPVTLSPGNPCAPVTTPQPTPANPCASFARLSDVEGAGASTSTSTSSTRNPSTTTSTKTTRPPTTRTTTTTRTTRTTTTT